MTGRACNHHRLAFPAAIDGEYYLQLPWAVANQKDSTGHAIAVNASPRPRLDSPYLQEPGPMQLVHVQGSCGVYCLCHRRLDHLAFLLTTRAGTHRFVAHATVLICFRDAQNSVASQDGALSQPPPTSGVFRPLFTASDNLYFPLSLCVTTRRRKAVPDRPPKLVPADIICLVPEVSEPVTRMHGNNCIHDLEVGPCGETDCPCDETVGPCGRIVASRMLLKCRVTVRPEGPITATTVRPEGHI
jgi:hypothetical protein